MDSTEIANLKTKKKTTLKRGFKSAVFASRLYAPLMPVARAFNHVSYLVQALAWCRKEYSNAPDDEARRALDCATRYEMYGRVLEREGLAGPIDYLEFGVYRGASLKWWTEHNKDPQSRFYGFDTFTGLPEDWGTLKEGTYTAEGQLPQLNDSRVSFVVGLFQNTLSGFLETYQSRRKVLHIDADLYTSTLYVLTRFASLLRPGDVIVFDEFLAWKYPDHEFRALRDFAASYQVKVALVGGADHFAHVAVKLL